MAIPEYDSDVTYNQGAKYENGHTIKAYTRRAIFSDELNKYCNHAKQDDFIEVTEWSNMEGFDIYIDTQYRTERFSLTLGEFVLLKKLIKKLEKT